MTGPRLHSGLVAASLLFVVATAPVTTARAQDKTFRGFNIKAASQASGDETERQLGLWVLEVRFKPLRLAALQLTNPKTGKKSKQLVWYLLYRAVNRHLPSKGDPDQINPQNTFDPLPSKPLFAPEFTLVTNDNGRQQIYPDQILPEAQAAIAIRERLPQLKNSVQVVGPIPDPTPANAKQDINPIYGVVTWTGVDARTDHVTIFMSGFSNGYRFVRGPVPFNTLSQAFTQGQIPRSTATWNGKTESNWTNLNDLLELSKDDPVKKQQIAKAPWFYAVEQTAAKPPTGSILWRKILMQRYWRPGDKFDQDETEFFLKGPNDEVYDPLWLYRPDRSFTAKAAPAAKKAATPSATSADSPKPAPN